MDIRKITDHYFVSPQIETGDVPEIAKAGFKTVICNRPDAEVPPSHQAQAIEVAVRAAGMEFHILPLTHQTMTRENVTTQMELAGGDGPVLAYCATGTRCTVAWSLASAYEGKDVDQILATAERGGYQLDTLRPSLEEAARSN